MDIISSTSKKFDFINDFSINTNLVGVPDMFMNNAEKIIQVGEFYPDPNCLKLRASLAKKYHNSPQNILCGNSASDLIFRISKVDHYQLNLDNEKHYAVDRLLEKINNLVTARDYLRDKVNNYYGHMRDTEQSLVLPIENED